MFNLNLTAVIEFGNIKGSRFSLTVVKKKQKENKKKNKQKGNKQKKKN
jgi:hypothetical protein